MPKRLDPIPPGEILLEEFLKPSAISQNALARALRVPARRIKDLVHGRESVTRDIAAGLAIYFGTTADLWTNLQRRYDAK
jgi:addiction module HigA family antidote